MKNYIKTGLIMLGMLFILTPINSEADNIQQKSEMMKQTIVTAKTNEKIERSLKNNKILVKKYNLTVKKYQKALKNYVSFNSKKKLKYKYDFIEPYKINSSMSFYGSTSTTLDYSLTIHQQFNKDIKNYNNKIKKITKEVTKEITKIKKAKQKYLNNQTKNPRWKGSVLNSVNGVVIGPCGKETYYNLNMSNIVSMMKNKGYDYKYWVRKDGCKMFGDYIMVAANLKKYPRGTIVETSLGKGIVCDTGGFAINGSGVTFDIATSW